MTINSDEEILNPYDSIRNYRYRDIILLHMDEIDIITAAGQMLYEKSI